jgi:adenylate kinase
VEIICLAKEVGKLMPRKLIMIENNFQEILEMQMEDLERQFQARLQEQVKSAADACQVSAERVKELSKVGASMLTGDNPAPTEVTAEVLVSNNDSIWLLQVSRNIFAGYECK